MEVKLKPLYAGENATMTDYSKPGTEILLIKCTEKGGELWVSKEGVSIEDSDIRILDSDNLELEAKFENDEYSRKIKTKFGEGILTFKYSN